MDTAKKEMLIAGLVGLFLGLSIGFFASNIKSVKISTSFQKPIPKETGQPSESPLITAGASSLSLSITSPDDESVTTIEKITIEGKTDPKAIIIVSDENDETVVTPNNDGSFTSKVTLTPEENQIVITSYKDGQIETAKRLVVYDKPED